MGRIKQANRYMDEYEKSMRGDNDLAWDVATVAFFCHDWRVSAFRDAASALLDGMPAEGDRNKLPRCFFAGGVGDEVRELNFLALDRHACPDRVPADEFDE